MNLIDLIFVKFKTGSELSTGDIFRLDKSWWICHNKVSLRLDDNFMTRYGVQPLEKQSFLDKTVAVFQEKDWTK